MGDRLGSFRGVCIERDDYLRQQAAMYRQLAEKTEHAVVKRDLVPLDKEQGSRPVACRAVFDARTAMSTLRPIATAERIFLRSSLSAIMYGPAVRTRWTSKIDERESCINVSGL